MADEKTKRLRTHVVKELYDTERDYTENLEFTVTGLLEKARVKGQHDNTFTESLLQKLFCNIENILDFHHELVAELKSCLKSGVSYGSQIATVYLKFKEEFFIYQEYGEGNEAAQKLLYELQDNESFQAFFLACLLLGGKDIGNGIVSYLFKPIQRVTKYPLLFRELEKYTPHDHPDFTATHEMGVKMREICFVINEAKRAVEKLDAITDWQASVDGWEGSKVTDTCNELIKEGPLIKISAGNTQERIFSLFDNLLVYCKKSLLSRTRPLLFRGRIPMENLDVEDIEDGTADFHTSGITVTNSWKVHNIAKDKWFVLVAKTPQEKKDWMDAIHNEKEKRKRTQASHGRAVYRLMVAKGENLYHQAKHVAPFIRDHKQRLRTVPKCFTGSEFVSWLVKQNEVSKEDEAIILGQHLLENGIIHHVNDKHQFKKGDLLYRFRYDDGTYRTKYASSELAARSVRMYCRLHGLFDPIIKDHRSLMGGTLRNVLNAQKLIEWLLDEHDIISREEGVALGRQFIALGVLRHATDGQDFRDTSSFYRFTADDVIETTTGTLRRQSLQQSQQPTKGVDFTAKQDQSCITLTVPYSKDEKGYGVLFKDEYPLPVTVKSTSPHAQWCGVTEGLTVIAVNGYYLTSAFGRTHFDLVTLTSPSIGQTAPPLLHLTVLRNSSEYVKIRQLSTGLGFHIKGCSPVIIHGVDKGSSAAEVGLLSGSCILRVGQQDVLKASHETVVAAVKKNLQDTSNNDGGPTVELKVTFSNMEHLVQYEYVTNNHTNIQVYERTLESPYTFNLPAQLMKLLASEAVTMATDLEGCGISNSHVTKYVTELRSVGRLYEKANKQLLGPRFPSYKPYGPSHAVFLEACPCNIHTSLMDVLSPSSSAPIPTSPPSINDDDSSSPVVSVDTISYIISTMACPSLTHTLTKSDVGCLEDGTIRRELMNDLKARAARLVDAQHVLRGFLDTLDNPIQESPTDHSSSFLTVPPTSPVNDHTPSSSPCRDRNASFSNPFPSIQLEIDGLYRKVDDLLSILKNKLLSSIVEETRGMLEKKNPTAIVDEFCKKIQLCKNEVMTAAINPGPKLTIAMQALVDTVSSYTQEVLLLISLSLATCDKPILLQTYDKLFSQCVVALATGFSHQLMAALHSQLNPEPEYGSNSDDISSAWLQLIANKGVLFHLESIMTELNDKEMKLVEGMDYVARQLKSVSLHFVAMESIVDVKVPLPEVTLSGCRSALHLTFALPHHLYKSLPTTLLSSRGVKVHPVLFNKGLYDIIEGSEAYELEREINSTSLQTLKSYYRQLRLFRLGRSQSLHRQTSEEKALAISETAEPLKALELLSHQLETAIREPTRPGLGLLTVAAELATRMGAVRVCVCDSGVFRSGLACSLEQVMILIRSHQLPLKNLRLALDTIRKKGTLSTLIRKNGADMSTSLPQKPPLLYQLPLTCDHI